MKQLIKSLFFCFLLFATFSVFCQNVSKSHIINLPDHVAFIENNHFKQGSFRNPQGDSLTLNNFYLKQNQKPLMPIMGEFQYSRYPESEWESELLKMKASGIEIIGFYDFWIHHEEKQGEFRFDKNLDVRAFLKLIEKHNLQAVARIGPWVHGETRNGGFPNWFVEKYQKSGFDRVSQNGELVPEIKVWFEALAKQFEELYYKDGGPIIGIQLDNEVRSNGPRSWGYEYLKSLKKTAQVVGMDVPYYMVTGWPGTDLPEDEVLPLWGGYPAAPWTGNSKPLSANKLYNFVTDRRDKTIGNDIIEYSSRNFEENTPLYKHPFLTVEMGGGIQDTYHRRPVIEPKDLTGLIYTRLGVGANMLGYYIYHGGQHPLSWEQMYSTQESKSSKYPYPNDYPMISYDFQAPLSEYGFMQPSFAYFKRIHQFIKSYESDLAPMIATIPEDNPKEAGNTDQLRYSIRSKDNSGFLFINNYARDQELSTHKNISFKLQNAAVNLRIPETGGITFPSGTQAIIPFNQDIEGVNLVYATAHPLTKLNGTIPLYVYYSLNGVDTEFKLNTSGIATLETDQAKVVQNGDSYLLTRFKPGKDCIITVTKSDGAQFKILVLSEEESLQTYVFNIDGKQTLLLNQNLSFYNAETKELNLRSQGVSDYSIYSFPALDLTASNCKEEGFEGMFTKYQINLPEAKIASLPFKEQTQTEIYQSYLDSLNGQTPNRPDYPIHFDSNGPYKTYFFFIPKMLPDYVSDFLIQVDYKGNTAAVYKGGILVADDYFNGKPMILSHNRINTDTELALQITPLMAKSSIFFEPEVNMDFAEKKHADLISIEAIPVYELILKK